MIKTFRFVYALMLVTLSVISYKASAEEKTLKWQTPTQRVDGTPLKEGEITKHHIYMNDKLLLSKTAPWHKLNIPEGKHCFKVQVEDSDRLKSDFSKIICVTIAKPIVKPKAPEVSFQ